MFCVVFPGCLDQGRIFCLFSYLNSISSLSIYEFFCDFGVFRKVCKEKSTSSSLKPHQMKDSMLMLSEPYLCSLKTYGLSLRILMFSLHIMLQCRQSFISALFHFGSFQNLDFLVTLLSRNCGKCEKILRNQGDGRLSLYLLLT